MKENGVKRIRPRLIVTNSETLTDSARCDIREVFDVEPTDVYESWEFGQIAWQCPRREGLHINSDQLIVELIRDGRPAEVGEVGEVVVTGLYGRAAPLIRYATGDLAIATERSCLCGRELPLLERIIGRTNERLILSDNTEVMATTGLYDLLNQIPGVKQFRAVQHVPGELEIWVIPDQRFGRAEERWLQERACHDFRLDRVIIKRTAYLKQSPAGKARLFVSTIPSEYSNVANRNMRRAVDLLG
jgi:phenylacetate-CoA ligase